MTDVAALGIAIDSSQVQQGILSLRTFASTAKDAQKAAEMAGKGTRASWDQIRSSGNPLESLYRRLTNESGKLGQAQVQAGKSAGLAAHQWQNLGYQVNDIVTSLASGQSPFMVMAQQGGQVQQILSSAPGGVSGALSAIGSRLASLVTPARVAVGGLAAVGAAGLLAYDHWTDAQSKVTLALRGIGAASGATAKDINSIAEASASAAGISVASARDIATALATTGKIGKDQFAAVIGVTKGFAKVMGVDTTEAADILAKAIANPVKGADQLNERLGFLDYSTQNLIKSLVTQNRVFEAQQIIIKGVKDSTAGAADSAGFLAKTWEGIKNAASAADTALGKAVDSATGGGTLEDQYARALQNVERIKSSLADDRGYADILRKSGVSEEQIKSIVPNISAMQEALRRAQAEADGLRASMDAVAAASQTAALNTKSMNLGPLLSNLVPEVAIKRALQDANTAVQGVSTDPAMLKALGLTEADVKLAQARQGEMTNSFLSMVQKTVAASDIQLKAVTARSPAERASVAYQQTMLQLAGQNISLSEKQSIASKAAAVAAAQAQQQFTEAGRARIMAAQDAVGSAQLEIASIGKTAGEVALLRANWQSYTSLRQEAARNHTSFDDAQYQRLVQINAEYAKQVQLAAQSKLQADIGFDRSQIGRTDAEQQVQATLRGAGIDPVSTQGEFLANQLRINAALKDAKASATDFAQGFAHDLMNGVSVVDALGNALNRLSTKLIDKSLDSLISGLFSGFTGGSGGGIGSFLSTLFKADGGYISGPGGPRSDSIPAMLSNGEFVVNAAATRRFGPLLEKINSGGFGFSAGGLTSASPAGEYGSELSLMRAAA